MDLDFDDHPSHHAAPAVRAGTRFKPKGRPQPKKKQVSFSTSQTTLPTNVAKETLSTQSQEGSVSLDGSSAIPSEALPSESNVPESGTIYQSTIETLSEENVNVVSREVHWSTEASVLRACTHVDLGGKRCDDSIDAAASAFPDDSRTQDSTIFRDFVTPETGEDEGHLDMETLDIVQEEGTTSSYVQHTGKLQPKPRVLDTVVEEPEPHYSVDGTGYFSMGTNESEVMDNVESRNDFSTYGHLQEEEPNIPEAPRETVPEMEAQNASGRSDNNTGTGEEENCLGNNTLEVEQSGRGKKKGKSKRASGRKRKNTSGEAPSEKPEKKFKHSSRRQKRTLEKELLETPDDEIKYLPIRDMLRLVEYKEWLEKKEAKGAVVPPTQESDMNASGNASGSQYDSQGFDAEDEFGMEDSENQEAYVVKPDSPVNYQTYMYKTSRTRWSKQDTELFYEGIREFGSNLSMIQHLFPNRTREQMKLKFKLEERRYPLKLNEALATRPKQLIHFPNVIKKLQEEAAAAKAAEEGEEEVGTEAEETNDVPQNEEEPEKAEETERASGVDGVKESDGGDGVRSDGGGDECDDGEGDDDFWNSYKSDM
ncbi:PREDICTED: protein IWS1 homolog [Camelina sativa]|uniref:Protein IWS1 homolog n=1 Tax=Camelina sativa TaxID=90675 RepID=A0ABM0TV00_CAMSA|nr:PREDICTED: protein IWS1 homolog [Camelina sativa]XP_010431877.1 PREDICTED: protein IWS1 homolog [Camelina sativa]XP_010431879.1 PREDICTED: protein IWS1 homolog [Camelina sativa]XP_010431880.1 PREDICTED: protein IWS1 homolog [Camelina sativa]